MRLEKVTGNPAACVQCVACLDMVQVGNTAPRNMYRKVGVWADLDGEAFKAYYCADCKQKVEAIQ